MNVDLRLATTEYLFLHEISCAVFIVFIVSWCTVKPSSVGHYLTLHCLSKTSSTCRSSNHREANETRLEAHCRKRKSSAAFFLYSRPSKTILQDIPTDHGNPTLSGMRWRRQRHHEMITTIKFQNRHNMKCQVYQGLSIMQSIMFMIKYPSVLMATNSRG
jgi:hypothetical protein